MKVAFNPKNEITNPNELFGCDVLFNQLVAMANRKSNTQLIGMRRFGKTSLFKCLDVYLKDDPNSKVYPLYLDYKEVGSQVKGKANVYRYAIAQFISKITNDKILTESEMFRGQKIEPSEFWEDVYIDLDKVNDIRVPGLFEDIITFFSDLLDKTILFLFDEYEYLFRFSFDDPTDFMRLRNFTSKQTDKGLNPFTFFITGCDSWEHLCSITGSPELNCIDQTLYVCPINFESFEKMWFYEIKQLETCPEDVKSAVDEFYKLSGGVPFYGKVLGSQWITSQSRSYNGNLKVHIQELYNSLENKQQHILQELLKKNHSLKSSSSLLDLIDRGLIIEKKSNKYAISIKLLEEYIKSINVIQKQNILPESHRITESIESLILTINKSHFNKKNAYIFTPLNEDISLYRDLKTECLSSEQFTSFSVAVYHIIFERTKANKNGIDISKNNLPNKFKNKNEFIDIIDILRHSFGKGHLMEKFTLRPGQLNKVQMLHKLTGSRNEPSNQEEFSFLQVKVLTLFETELKRLKVIVNQM
ncbi:hypothetical protein [Algibacter sp. Ld11]|uniref:hypothetical protein n=1 Tax=Algibacter sp. Ld11 TaxID=649150 RepID=UPI00386CE5D1